MDIIKDTLFKFLRLDNLFSHLTGFVETQAALLKMEVREEVAKIIARGLVVGFILLLAFLFLLFLSIGLAHYLNDFFHEAYIGYWIIAGLYGLPCVVFLLLRKQISTAIEKYFTVHLKYKEK
ncbi:MAG: phage holin family protein [Cyclobacteriaceae bacterium]|nr:phage holin family protein [Cyclobacteriaceae bacterium]